MSLENALAANTAALVALTAAIQAQQGAAPAVAPSYPPPAPAPQPQQQPPVPPMPAQPFPAPQQAAPAAPQGLPFSDNVSAAAWATAAWQQMAAVNSDLAMTRFQALMQSLGAADFNSVTPAQFGTLYQGIQAIKAEMGIQG